MTNRLPMVLTSGALALLALAGCRPPPVTATESRIMNLAARVEVSPQALPQLGAVSGLAVALMTETLSDLDPTRPGSDINKLNRVAQTVRLQVSRSTFRLIDLAHYYGELTDGAFDMTTAPLENVWGLDGSQPEEIPSDELIAGVRAGVGHHAVQIFDQGAVAFTQPETQIGFRLLGPAYAVDIAILDLRRRGYGNLSVQLGPVHRVLGSPTPDLPWRAELPHPTETSTALGSIRLDGTKTALVVNRRHDPVIQIGTNTIGTVIDPRTGKPAEGTHLVAVLAPSATMAQALAQALMVVGVDQAPALLAHFPKCEALLVPDQAALEIWRTDGFAERLALGTNVVATQHTLAVEHIIPADEPAAAEPAPAP